jgi:ketosteroid isomerase-like protein
MRSLTKPVLASLAIIITNGSIARTQDAAAPNARRLLTALYSAVERGDSTSARSLVADDLVWIVGSGGATVDKSQLLTAASAPSPARFTLDSVRTHRYGQTLIADYIRRDRWPLGNTSFMVSWRAVAVFASADNAWRLVHHSLSWLAQPVRPTAIDSAALQAFVGRYRIAPDYVDNVHWESGHLVATASGQSQGARLVPVSETAFSPDGIGAMLVFERNAQGRVVGYVQAYPDGRIVRAPRMP